MRNDGGTFVFFAHGEPAPKGSYKAVRNPKTGKTLLLPMSKREKPWRQTIVAAIENSRRKPDIGDDYAVEIEALFLLRRPKTVGKMERKRPTKYPDLDKLQRALGDAMTDAGLYSDDSQIVKWTASKEYVEDKSEEGVSVIVKWRTNHD